MNSIVKNQKRDITAIVIILTVFAAHAAAVTVSVDAPLYVSGSGFDVEIKIDDVDDLASGQFNILFNSSVVNVTDLENDIEAGEIGGTAIPIDGCSFVDVNLIRVLFKLPIGSSVSGHGSLATIRFEVVGTDGDTSFLNLTDIEGPIGSLLLVNEISDEIPADWVSGMVTLGDPPAGTKPAVTVYVKNLDDDKLDIHLLVDGTDEGFESISSGKTKEYDDYSMEEGTHTFKIRWFDTDTDEWYEKTEEHTITDATTIVLMTDKHDEDEDKMSAHVYVNNPDNDNLNVYLHIDGNYKKYMGITSNSTGDYGEYEFEEDEDTLHSFKIKWFDPGTDQDYEKIVRSYITSEEAITIYIDKHTEEDMVLLPAETPTTVPTSSTLSSTPTQTSTRPIKESQPTPTTTHVSPTLSDDHAGGNDLIHGITPAYTLVGLVAVLFVLIQIRRI